MQLGRRTSRWIIVVTMGSHGLRRPIPVKFFPLLSSSPSTASMTDRHRHDGPSRVFVPKHLTLGIWVLEYFSELHDEPAGQTVMGFVTPHLVRLPHLPSAAALVCHLRTVTSTTDRHNHDGPSQAP